MERGVNLRTGRGQLLAGESPCPLQDSIFGRFPEADTVEERLGDRLGGLGRRRLDEMRADGVDDVPDLGRGQGIKRVGI